MDAENFNPFTQEILEKARIGIWVIEILNNQHPKMTIDGVMEDLFGVKGKKYTPEQLYDIWYNNLDKDHLDEINKALSKMKKGTKIEVQYPWKHPKKGIIYFRCGGVRDKSFKEGYRFGGSCQDISEIVHIQKQTEKKEEELKMAKKDILTYTGIMQAICRNYESLFYVNIRTGEYQEFVSNGSFKSLKVQRHGKDFFEDSANDIPKVIYVTDRRKLLDFMKKETIMPDLLERKTMSISYRILVNKTPVYYQMKVVPAADNDQDHRGDPLPWTELDVRDLSALSGDCGECLPASCDPLVDSKDRQTEDDHEDGHDVALAVPSIGDELLERGGQDPEASGTTQELGHRICAHAA